MASSTKPNGWVFNRALTHAEQSMLLAALSAYRTKHAQAAADMTDAINKRQHENYAQRLLELQRLLGIGTVITVKRSLTSA